jgi:hypothetical protein
MDRSYTLHEPAIVLGFEHVNGDAAFPACFSFWYTVRSFCDKTDGLEKQRAVVLSIQHPLKNVVNGDVT